MNNSAEPPATVVRCASTVLLTGFVRKLAVFVAEKLDINALCTQLALYTIYYSGLSKHVVIESESLVFRWLFA